MIKSADDTLQKMVDTAEKAAETLQNRHRPEEAAYQELLKKSKEYQAKIRERDDLGKQVAKIKAEKAEAEQLERKLQNARDERKTALARYSELCEARYRVREKSPPISPNDSVQRYV